MSKYLALLLILPALFAPQTLVHAQSYDIKNDYCGILIESQYCKCAFHDEQCASTGYEQAGAEEYLYSQFDAWTTEQEIKRCDALGMDYEG